MAIYELWIEPPPFNGLKDEGASSYYLYNSRDFQVGDIIKFCERFPDKTGKTEGAPTGDYLYRKVTYVQSDCGIPYGHVVLSLKDVSASEYQKALSATGKCCRLCRNLITEDEGCIEVELLPSVYKAEPITQKHHVDCFLGSLKGREFSGHTVVSCKWSKPESLTKGEEE